MKTLEGYMKKTIITLFVFISILFARPSNELYINGEWYQCKTYFYDENGGIEKVIDSDSSIVIYKNFYNNGTLIKSIGNQVSRYYQPVYYEIKLNSCGDTVFFNLKAKDFETRSTFIYKYDNGCKVNKIKEDSWVSRNENGKKEISTNEMVKKYTYLKDKIIIKLYTNKEFDKKEEHIYKSGKLIKKVAYFSDGRVWYSEDYQNHTHIVGDAVFEELIDEHYGYKNYCTRRLE